MKTIISFSKLAAITLLFTMAVSTTSCKKGSTINPGDSFIKFKVDGIEQNFTLASGFNHEDYLVYQVKGSLATDTAANYFQISIYNDGPLSLNFDYSTPDWQVEIFYHDAASVRYENPFDQISTIKITEVTATRIKGTFSGVVKNGSTTKTITEGTFDIARTI